MPFETMERIFGLLGLCLLVFVVTVWKIGPDWGAAARRRRRTRTCPRGETPFTYAYYGIALFGAAMTPYEVFFFSSGAVEDGWTVKDLNENRANVFIGFPLGGLLSLAIMACAHLVLAPARHRRRPAVPGRAARSRVVRRQARAGRRAHRHLRGDVRRRARDVAVGRATRVAQYFGWPWGKHLPAARGGALPRRGARGRSCVGAADRAAAASTR